MHWAEGWLIRSGVDDCVDLVENVLLEEFNVEVQFPKRERSIRSKDSQVRRLRGNYAIDVDFHCLEPGEGDIVLMKATNRRHAIGHHMGVWCCVASVPHVLHKMSEAGARLTRMDRLAGIGLALEGIYKLREPWACESTSN